MAESKELKALNEAKKALEGATFITCTNGFYEETGGNKEIHVKGLMDEHIEGDVTQTYDKKWSVDAKNQISITASTTGNALTLHAAGDLHIEADGDLYLKAGGDKHEQTDGTDDDFAKGHAEEYFLGNKFELDLGGVEEFHAGLKIEVFALIAIALALSFKFELNLGVGLEVKSVRIKETKIHIGKEDVKVDGGEVKVESKNFCVHCSRLQIWS